MKLNKSQQKIFVTLLVIGILLVVLMSAIDFNPDESVIFKMFKEIDND